MTKHLTLLGHKMTKIFLVLLFIGLGFMAEIEVDYLLNNAEFAYIISSK